MLKELAVKYYSEGYNCAESIVLAGNEAYGLGLSAREVRAFGGFGGGMQCGDICGGLSGAVAVVSARYIASKAHESPDLQKQILRLVRSFQERFGSRVCREIKPKFHDPAVRCQNTVAAAAEVLESVIGQLDKERNA